MKQQVKGLVRQATGAAQSSTPAAKPTSADLASGFLGAVQVEQVPRQPLFNVSVTSSDPQFAARAADTLASEYVQFNLESAPTPRARASTSSPAKWPSSGRRSRTASARWRIPRDERRAVARGSPEHRRGDLNQVNDRSTRIRTERIQKEALYNQIDRCRRRRWATRRGVREPRSAEPAHAARRAAAPEVQLDERYGPTRRSSRTKTPSSIRPSSCKTALNAADRRSAANTKLARATESRLAAS